MSNQSTDWSTFESDNLAFAQGTESEPQSIYPEPSPHWENATLVWQEAWELHVYLFATLYLLIFLVSIYVGVTIVLEWLGVNLLSDDFVYDSYSYDYSNHNQNLYGFTTNKHKQNCIQPFSTKRHAFFYQVHRSRYDHMLHNPNENSIDNDQALYKPKENNSENRQTVHDLKPRLTPNHPFLYNIKTLPIADRHSILNDKQDNPSKIKKNSKRTLNLSTVQLSLKRMFTISKHAKTIAVNSKHVKRMPTKSKHIIHNDASNNNNLDEEKKSNDKADKTFSFLSILGFQKSQKQTSFINPTAPSSKQSVLSRSTSIDLEPYLEEDNNKKFNEDYSKRRRSTRFSVRHRETNLSSMQKTTLLLALMVFSFSFMRMIYLFVDPYNKDQVLPFIFSRILFSGGFPGFSASFMLLLLILLDSTKLSLGPPRLVKLIIIYPSE